MVRPILAGLLASPIAIATLIYGWWGWWAWLVNVGAPILVAWGLVGPLAGLASLWGEVAVWRALGGLACFGAGLGTGAVLAVWLWGIS